MTQAMNLANFANSLDSSGGVPPTQLNSVVPLSKGGTNASTASAARTNLGLAIGTDVAAQAYAVPSGGIIMWSGSIASIPSGWLLCNGAGGTPDLRDRFIVGAGNSYGVAATGGNKDAIVVSHSHTAGTADAGSHNHNIFSGDNAAPVYSANDSYNIRTGRSTAPSLAYFNAGQSSPYISTAGTHSHGVTVNAAGSSGTNANLPPYYALAFIMKT